MEIEWVTTGAAAEALGVTAETVRRYIRTGRLRAQADFLAGGGRPLDSPLAGSIRYSSRWTGVGGGLSDLLDTLLPGR